MIEALKDKYIIGNMVGKGGMAKIYRAVSKADGKTVAIKVLKTDNIDSHRNKKRFLSEIKAIQNVKSPYVVEAFDYEWDEDVQYIAMEFIDGHILKDYVGKRGRLTVDEVVEYTKQITLGLHEIHRSGIIHRDIKSTNIMITDHGQIKIIDLGIALHDEASRVTRTDSVIGSVQYIAPELLEKEEASARSDIYALGILMYEMLIGEVPFKEATALTTAQKHRNSRVPHVNKIFNNIPQSVANVVIKATAREPHLRYTSAYKMYEDITSALSGKRLYEQEINLNGKEKKSATDLINSKWFVWLMGVVVIGLLVAIIVALAVNN